jgi:two-component system response regulator YesN
MKKYAVLLVDDDPLVLKHLSTMISWDAYGFTIVGTKTDGPGAIAFLDDHPVSLIISDVNMPMMDGLEFLKIVHGKHPDIQTILLTVNRNFGCIQTAMNEGISSYLLKPLHSAELVDALRKVTANLDQTAKMDALKTQAVANERMARDQFLAYLLSNSATFTQSQIQMKLQQFHCQIPFSRYQLLSVHLTVLDESIISEKVLNEVENIIEDTIFPYAKGVVFPDLHQALLILLSVEDVRLYYLDQAKQIARSIRKSIQERLRFSSTIIISRLYEDLTQLSQCYYETLYFIPLTEESRKQKILVFEKQQNAFEEPSLHLEELRKKILLFLRMGQLEKEDHLISETFDHFYQRGNFELFNMVKMEFILCGIIFMQENRLSMENLRPAWTEPPSSITRLDRPSQCKDFVLTWYRVLMTAVSQSKVRTSQRIAQRCLELIGKHFGDPTLSVGALAKALYMSEDYLSRQFRNEMKTPLVRYIAQERLANAKRLLDAGNGNIQQISALCGFSDSLYFSKCFKKEYGVSPSEYQAKNARGHLKG